MFSGVEVVRGKAASSKAELRNWRQLTEKQLSKLTPIERSRYMAVSWRLTNQCVLK